MTIKVSSELSGGSMTVYESTRARGDQRGPGPHAHASFDEVFYVLEGEYEFVVEDRVLRAREGSTVFIPRGAFHDFHNAGVGSSRLLTFCSPGGIEDFFQELSQFGSVSRGRGASGSVE
ncbi:MAG TPA: cupin domain-containing protein [Actinomycetota bacterium]|nr:cupin domain-containing protein [Actinomycetota bacterium]